MVRSTRDHRNALPASIAVLALTLAGVPTVAADASPAASPPSLAAPTFPSIATLTWEPVEVDLAQAEVVRLFVALPDTDPVAPVAPASPSTTPTAAPSAPAGGGDAAPGGFLAAGMFHDPDLGNMLRALAWTSPDGRAWDPADLSAPPSSYATTAVNLGTEALLIGTRDQVKALKRGGYVPSAVVWSRGADGTWTLLDDVPADALAWGSGTIPEGVAVLGRSVPKKGKPSTNLMGSMQQPAIWTSADGRAWVRTLLETEPPSLAAAAAPMSIAVAPDGTRLIGGVDTSTGEELLWRSTDGVEWQPVTSPHPGAGSGFLSLVGTPTGFALALADGERRTRSTVWASADGLTWEAVKTADTLLFLRSVGTGIIGFGADRIVASADGRSWEEVATTTFAGVTVIGASLTPDGGVIVGAIGGGRPLSVWIGAAEGD
jgi:hypothetical protein